MLDDVQKALSQKQQLPSLAQELSLVMCLQAMLLPGPLLPLQGHLLCLQGRPLLFLRCVHVSSPPCLVTCKHHMLWSGQHSRLSCLYILTLSMAFVSGPI